MRSLAAGAAAGAAAVLAGGRGTEAKGDTGCGVDFASAASKAAAVSTGGVPKVRTRGKARGTAGEGSQTDAAVSDTGSEGGAAAGLQQATVGRRKGRAVIVSDPEARMRRSAQIVARKGVPPGGGPRASAGGVDTASEEEERGTGTDTREEISEVEWDGDSDVSSGETGGVPEGAHAREVRTDRGRRRVRSPVTSRSRRRGHARGSTSRGSTPSPVPMPSASIPVVLNLFHSKETFKYSASNVSSVNSHANSVSNVAVC